MPFIVDTSNSHGITTLVAVIEQVSAYETPSSPPVFWDNISHTFKAQGTFTFSHAYITLTEDSSLPGLYSSGSIDDIDGTSENLRIMVFDTASGEVLGIDYNIPRQSSPSVTLDFNVTEDRT